MPKKKSKLATPAWILEGYDSPEDYEKAKGISKKPKKQGRVFTVRKCPKCGSEDVGLVLSGSISEEDSDTGKDWECRKCKWSGSNVVEEELDEDEFMEYMDRNNKEDGE